MMEGTERGYQRSLRDVRKVGLQGAIYATRRATTMAVRLQRRNRAFTTTQAFRQPLQRRRPSTISQIASGLFSVAKGEANIPLPGVGMAGRAMQLRAIGRQQLARTPFVVKAAAAGGAGVAAARAFEIGTGISPERAIHDVARRGFDLRGRLPGRRNVPRGNLAVGSELPPSHTVVRTWQTFPGGPVFARLADGHIAVQRKDGTIKHFRPYRPVVIPRKWNARSMSRVATALKRQRKTATKIMQITGGMPKGRK